MQKIIKKLEEVVGLCEARLKKVEQDRNELAALRITLEQERKDLDGREKDIDAREAKLKDSELIGKTIQEANQILADASQRSKNVRIEEDALEASRQEHAKTIAEDKAEIERLKEKVAKQSAEIDAKAKTYKQEVMAEIVKQASK